jgi:hypothetical protein
LFDGIRETHAEQRVAEEFRHQLRLVQSPKEPEVTPGGAIGHAMVLASTFRVIWHLGQWVYDDARDYPVFESPLSVTFPWKVGPQLGSFCASWWRNRHLTS